MGRLDGAEQLGRGPGGCVFTAPEPRGHLPTQCWAWWGSRSDWGDPGMFGACSVFAAPWKEGHAHVGGHSRCGDESQGSAVWQSCV